MSRKPSEATQLRQLKAEARVMQRQVNTMKLELTHYRGRATKAETEAADWKKRFDLLLARTPPVNATLPRSGVSAGEKHGS